MTKLGRMKKERAREGLRLLHTYTHTHMYVSQIQQYVVCVCKYARIRTARAWGAPTPSPWHACRHRRRNVGLLRELDEIFFLMYTYFFTFSGSLLTPRAHSCATQYGTTVRFIMSYVNMCGVSLRKITGQISIRS